MFPQQNIAYSPSIYKDTIYSHGEVSREDIEKELNQVQYKPYTAIIRKSKNMQSDVISFKAIQNNIPIFVHQLISAQGNLNETIQWCGIKKILGNDMSLRITEDLSKYAHLDHGSITEEDVEILLKDKNIGTGLLRRHVKSDYIISFVNKEGKIEHSFIAEKLRAFMETHTINNFIKPSQTTPYEKALYKNSILNWGILTRAQAEQLVGKQVGRCLMSESSEPKDYVLTYRDENNKFIHKFFKENNLIHIVYNTGIDINRMIVAHHVRKIVPIENLKFSKLNHGMISDKKVIGLLNTQPVGIGLLREDPDSKKMTISCVGTEKTIRHYKVLSVIDTMEKLKNILNIAEFIPPSPESAIYSTLLS